ncbi:MAG: hypothetical protein HYT79_01710 [Elusimicrobia bacterium]|nr:hypothetical protein [Elusimicrobiota bacterium]
MLSFRLKVIEALSPQHDPNEKPPVYILTDQGLKSQEEIEAEELAALAPKKRGPSPWLVTALLGAALAWGIDSERLTKMAEVFFEQESRLIALEPYRIWAANNPLAYEDVTVSPDSFIGKAVLWEIVRLNGQGHFYQGHEQMPVFWREHEPIPPLESDHPVRVLGRIDGMKGEAPLLFPLEVF